MKRTILLSLILLQGLLLQAQEKTAPFWGKQEVYLENQTTKTFQLVDSILNEYRPTDSEPSLARQAALYLLDGIFHDTRLDGSPCISSFMEVRLKQVLADMKKPLTDGMKIYKLYNDGFIVKTKNATIAFDLYRGGKTKNGSHLIANEMMQAIVSECDLMFLTHNHPDHVDPGVIDLFTRAGKTVVAPNVVQPENGEITHIRSTQPVNRTFVAKGGKINVTIFPGHQEELDNNIYVVTTPDDFTFAHTGDQYDIKDLQWLRNIHSKIPPLDVLLINCWANSLRETVDGFNPQLVLTGHENELGHTIDHRESYWTSYIKLKAIERPNSLLTWGEWITYDR